MVKYGFRYSNKGFQTFRTAEKLLNQPTPNFPECCISQDPFNGVTIQKENFPAPQELWGTEHFHQAGNSSERNPRFQQCSRRCRNLCSASQTCPWLPTRRKTPSPRQPLPGTCWCPGRMLRNRRRNYWHPQPVPFENCWVSMGAAHRSLLPALPLLREDSNKTCPVLSLFPSWTVRLKGWKSIFTLPGVHSGGKQQSSAPTTAWLAAPCVYGQLFPLKMFLLYQLQQNAVLESSELNCTECCP